MKRLLILVFLCQFLFVTYKITAQETELFRTTPVFKVGDGPVAITSCDLNNDGWPDIITANESFDDVAVLLNDQNGGFYPQVRFGINGTPVDVKCTDFDNDGKLDLISAHSNGITILPGNGDGTFAVENINFGPINTVSFVIEDFNNDKKRDILTHHVFSNNPATTRLFLNLGDMSFQENTLSLPNSGKPIIASYMDEDVYIDIISDGYIVWGDKNIAFDAFTSLSNRYDSANSADIDEDGIIDLLIANTSYISVYKGQGDRTFDSSTMFQVGPNPRQLLAIDVNDDNHVDIIAVNESSNDISVLLGNGDGTFQQEVRFGAGDNPLDLVIDDFDGDGVLDVVTSNYSSNNVSLLLGNGDGTFRWEPRFPVGSDPRSVTVCDLNHDNILDIASANYLSNNVSVLIGSGNGNYLPAVNYPVAERPVDIRCADIKEDGHPDLIVVNNSSSEVSVLLGFGDGTFSSKPRFSVGAGPDDMDICDINEDGHLDVITANGIDSSILLGIGNGFFQPFESLPGNANLVQCVDFSGDRHEDLISIFGNSIFSRIGTGKGSFFLVLELV